jgi:antitoxin (DNA-binding transcriptional repressor) of toxin-antitoxin stability system
MRSDLEVIGSETMIDVPVSEFRANMNAILQLVKDGEIVSLLLRGEEIAKIVPPDYARIEARKALDKLSETATVGDVLSPIGEQWSEQQ